MNPVSPSANYTAAGALSRELSLTIPAELAVRAESEAGHVVDFRVAVRIDTPKEAAYYRHGGILNYVLRDLARPQSHTG